MEDKDIIIISKKREQWKISFIFSLISFIAVIILFLNPPSDSEWEPIEFLYIFTFFFPMLLFSFSTGLIAFIFFILSIRKVKISGLKNIIIRIALPIFLLLPMTIYVLNFSYILIRILIQTGFR